MKRIISVIICVVATAICCFFSVSAASQELSDIYTVTEKNEHLTSVTNLPCSECGNFMTEYEGTSATCTEAGYTAGTYCDTCKMWVSGHEEIAKLPHTFTTYISDSNATCTADGTKTAVCDVCNTVKNTKADLKSALGHKAVTDKAVAATCTESGLTEGSHCSRCDITLVKQEKVYAGGHTSDGGKITRIANYKQWGLKAYSCTVCGDVLSTESIERFTLKTPAKVKASNVKTTSMKISWGRVEGAETYRVLYSLDREKWSKAEVSGSTSLTLKKLKKGKKYYIKVVALTGDNESEESKVITKATKPAKITLKKVKSPKKKQAEITWKTVVSATGYEIVYSTSKNFTKKTTKTATVKKQKTNKKTVKKLKSGKKYYFKVRAYTVVDGKKVYGAYSKVKSVKIEN